jgi:hypothetical protein
MSDHPAPPGSYRSWLRSRARHRPRTEWFGHPLGLAAHFLLGVVPVLLLLLFLAVVAHVVRTLS